MIYSLGDQPHNQMNILTVITVLDMLLLDAYRILTKQQQHLN